MNAAWCFTGTHTVTWGHCEIYQSNIRDKRIPREAFSDLGDIKVENVTVTFHDEKDEDILAEE